MISEAKDRRTAHWIVVIILGGMLLRIVLAIFPMGPDNISAESLQRLTLIQTAVEDGWKGFLYPRFNVDGPRPVYIPQEFPIFINLAAEVCRLTGWSILTSGKVVSLVVAFFILVLSVRLFELWLPPKYRPWALAVMAFSPTVAVLGRNISHDHLTLLFAIISCLVTERLNHSQGTKRFWLWFVIAGPMYALTLASKITVAVGAILACALYLVFTNRRFRHLLILGIPFLVALAGYGLWHWHCIVAKSPSSPFGFGMSLWRIFFNFSLIWRIVRQGIYFRWATTLMTPFGIIFAGIGLILLVQWLTRFRFLLAWVIGTGVSFLILFRAYLHWYYWLILSPGIAALIALGLQSTIEFLSATKPRTRRWIWGTVSVITIFSAVLLYAYFELPRWQHWRQGSQVLKAMTPPDALVIYTGPWVYNVSVGVTFFSERRGWIVSEGDRAELIQERVNEGARWLTGFDLNSEEIMPYLGLETNSGWVLRASGTVRARQSGDGIALKERPYVIYEYIGGAGR